MYQDSVTNLARLGECNAPMVRTLFFAFLIGAAMAGAYIGFGDILTFPAGVHVDPATFSMRLIGDYPANITVAGALHNLVWITNLIGGTAFMALGRAQFHNSWHVSVVPAPIAVRAKISANTNE
ncbi:MULTISPECIES: hypothetical protein [Rhizobium]|uniref:Membrane protein n=1 Tax=Rhizobium favelukesii TaxID=348824 RepID=W6RUB1_9HYPH|nr:MULTISPECIES: hypothetical protein [Rhizobium]MCA0801322.1 hypothetical protein [Rhizobium sp. T1473]MCS0457790.1 hypothetical protein [Rhizobium favelukesii]UFS80439.1 hypothetical protein LPB79_04180 [Rhizobium sp. T136]CDM62273.1 putative membrane protein [Rhizobium favelukesii]